FATQAAGTVVADIVDPHSLHLADALPKLQGMALYAETHAKAYRRIESVAEAMGKLRVLDLTNDEVRKAIVSAKDAPSLFNGGLAKDY
ncbi:MAG: type III restriction endonuclease subunit R, partial [Nitrosomonadaceae bacterium]|nr:type III restriction endonuclease subunit R [Nitrosomonadaceae bacterium]